MKLVHPASLSATLDAVNESLWEGVSLPLPARREAAKYIASRQGLPRSYRGMFAPTKQDYEQGARLFTGEKVTSGAGTAHILSEEACSALLRLQVKDKAVASALQKAGEAITEWLPQSIGVPGTYCCGTCSVSLWRHLSAGGLDDPERQLVGGVKYLKQHRTGDGRWQRFPFYYTLFALSEFDVRGVKAELKYAAPACERALRNGPQKDKYSKRKQDLLRRILAVA